MGVVEECGGKGGGEFGRGEVCGESGGGVLKE